MMILPQVHLRKPCYDFCPVQMIAIAQLSTLLARKLEVLSVVLSKPPSPGQRRAVCTKPRDVISAR